MGLKRTILCAALAGGPALAQDPLSAIDWLENNPPAQVVFPVVPKATVAPDEPPVSSSALSPNVTVTALDSPGPVPVGLLPAHVTGFPVTLWRGSDVEGLARSIAKVPVEGLPPLQALLFSLLLAESLPPEDDSSDRLMAARSDRLLTLGAVDQAAALLERAGAPQGALFARWFETALLSGQSDRACAALVARPSLMDDFSARVFCLAQTGDWDTAVTTLATAELLGTIPKARADLLALFLDPELAEDVDPPRYPSTMTALDYRLFEALGEAPATAALPRVFATLDLGGDRGWKAQIDAAERLTRAGSLSENRLLGIYTDRRAAASGGAWDRVGAIARFETALTEGKPDRLGPALNEAWQALYPAGLGTAFSQLFAEALLKAELPEDARPIARRTVLLSPRYEQASVVFGAGANGFEQFLTGVAAGIPDATLAETTLQKAIAAGFEDSDAPDPEITETIRAERLGEIILHAIDNATQGARGDMLRLSEALSSLRQVGLEDTARRTALHILIKAEAL